MYLFVSFVGKLVFFLRPFFAIADSNVAKMAAETREFNLAEAFHGSNNPKKYFGLAGAYLVRDLTICMVAFLSYVPLMIYKAQIVNVNSELYNELMDLVLMIIHIAISSIALLVGFINSFAYGFVGANLTDGETSDIMFVARHYSKGIKGRIFWSYFGEYILSVPIVAGGVYGMIYVLGMGQEIWYPLIEIGIWVLVFLLALAWFGVVSLSSLTGRYEVFKAKIPLKKPIVVKEVAGEEPSYVSLFKDDEKDLEAITISQLKKKEGK